MIDIFDIRDGELVIYDSIVPKASNLLRTQIGSLEYLPDFGIDLDYFLNNPIAFQNESFKSYLIDKMAQNSINVTDAIETVEKLFNTLSLAVSPDNDKGDGFIV